MHPLQPVLAREKSTVIERILQNGESETVSPIF